MHRLATLSLFCCLSLWGQAQGISLQELVNRKQYTTVLATVDSLTSMDSLSYSTMFAVAQAYEGILKYRQAYGYYQHCLRLDSTQVDVLNALARTATNLGRATDAERYFHQVLSTDSLNFYANYQLARLYFQLSDYGKAISLYERLQQQDSTNPTLWSNLGDCYARMELYPQATINYFQAYNLNRENASLGSALINTMLRMGGAYTQEALAICDTALYYNPENRQLLRNKGMALYTSKQFVTADSLYSALLAAGDSSYLTLKYGGASKYYAGQAMASIEPLEIAYRMDSTSVEVCLLLGSALGKTYDRKRAYILFNQAEEAMKPHKLLTNQLLLFRAETLWKDSRFGEARLLYYNGWKQDPSRLDLLSKIECSYQNWDQKFLDEADIPRALFIKHLYLTEYLKSGQSEKELSIYRPFLQSIYEDAFFRSMNELALIAPDGKKTKLSVIDLRALINLLPEISAEDAATNEAFNKMLEQLKQFKNKEKKNQ